MSGPQAETLWSAIAESARLVGATCSRAAVRPVLAAYEDALTTDGGVVFSVETGRRGPRELEYTVQVAGIDDLHARTRAHGLVEGTDHPVATLFPEVQERIAVDVLAVDGGVVGGFKKLYAVFARQRQSVAALAGIPSAPHALAANADLFARYGLHEATVVGVDYRNRTMNVYFQLPAPGALAPAEIRSLLRELGLPEPSEPMLDLAGRAYRVYATVGWELVDIQRMSFAPAPRRGVDLATLPVPLEPEIERFMTGAPHTYGGERIRTAVVKWSPDGEALDLGSYYQVSPAQLTALTAAGPVPDERTR